LKFIVLILLSFAMSGCALFGQGSKRAAEVVPSCFSDGEDKTTVCKAQRINDDGRIVTTRCIGSLNNEAKLNLRGKCVEKICSGGSNTDCTTRGEFAVLEQYAELSTANLFASDEDGQARKTAAVPANMPVKKGKKVKGTAAAAPAAVAPEAVTAHEQLPPTVTPAPQAYEPPEKPVAKTEVKKEAVKDEPAAGPQPMNLVLKPAKKTRAQASVRSADKGFKKVCIAKDETAAPEHLRGKCATRHCAKGKCSYQGRKEMFDWVSKNE